MVRTTNILLLVFTLMLGYQCKVDEPSFPKDSVLVIASDFLTEKDTNLFVDFTKKNNVQIKIMEGSSDSILALSKQLTYNTPFDAVLLKSTYTLNKFSEAKVLQPLLSTYNESLIQDRSPRNDWVVFGYDLFILDHGDTTIEISTYNELTFGKKWLQSMKSKTDYAAFYSSVLFQFGPRRRNKAIEWLNEFHAQMMTENLDSISPAAYSLNRYSIAKTNKHNIKIPNQVRGGTFYDGWGLGIIYQSKNYAILEKLMHHISNPHFNQTINARLHMYPCEDPKGTSDFEYQNDYPLLYRCNPNQMVRQYRDLDKIFKKWGF